MAESGGIREKARGLTDRAKSAVGQGDPPLATEVDGRIPAIREALKAFGEGDHDRFLSVFDEEVAWHGPSGQSFPGAGSFTGRDEIRDRFVTAVGRTYASFGFQPGRYLENEDEEIVIVLGTFVGEPRDQGKLDVPAVMVWEWDKDRVTRVTIYADSDAFPKVIDEEEDEKREKESEEDGESSASGEGSGDEKESSASGADSGDETKSSASGSDSRAESEGDSAKSSEPRGDAGGDRSRDTGEDGSDGGGDQSSVDERRDESGHEAERAREEGT